MSSTRELILQTILSRQRTTINELAEKVGINPISVRHHISKMEAEGLVDSEEERHGVGRPRRLYFLTESGLERFPTRYLRLTKRLLARVKDALPPEMVSSLFAQMGADLAEDFVADHDLQQLPMEERLDLLKGLLQREGFEVEWKRGQDRYLIRELNCPYHHIGQHHPEVCAIDRTLISSVLSVPATKIQCILDGDSHCTYVVPTIAPGDIPVTGSSTQE